MKTKLGNFLEVFGIVFGVVGIVGFIILLINSKIFFGVVSLMAGICIFVLCLAISQILFSIENIEEDISTIGNRLEVLEQLNRKAVENDLFSTKPKKTVNIPQKKVTSSVVLNATDKKATCYKCGHVGKYQGNNFCPKCGNHSFYIE